MNNRERSADEIFRDLEGDFGLDDETPPEGLPWGETIESWAGVFAEAGKKIIDKLKN